MLEGLSAVEILDDVLDRYREEMIDGEASLSVAIFEYFSGEGTLARKILCTSSTCFHEGCGKN